MKKYFLYLLFALVYLGFISSGFAQEVKTTNKVFHEQYQSLLYANLKNCGCYDYCALLIVRWRDMHDKGQLTDEEFEYLLSKQLDILSFINENIKKK